MRITKIASQIAESALSLVGIRILTEEPHYVGSALGDGVELRRYGPRMAAETTVTADEDRARNIGFRRLANYIFGANHRAESIAMTAPVAQSGREEIAMTTPVAQSRAAGDRWTIRFFMPSKWTMDTLPEPDDENVALVTVPGQTVAVLRFGGDRSPTAVTARSSQLLTVLRDNGIEADGEPVAWFYDPPWTLPFLRRNEIAVPVKAQSP
ncbi:heme-binding protein [Mycolicibacterium agri]|uniref:Heme-binding protein n=1 Tax=Mycolicibacterium agri TaxID=36811 RepID=A0A2A7N7H6_MYCAG|nr:heme-binding protein [Mycolicibacterium agri]PEG39789.1 heme-binding protein [Mycolicibacterium agri]GFG52497.1 heme-binding protein [Mycolicibacterium agri]